ncbi:hypothetical protein FS749_016144 [Ceratobasidium sp. UAMH 11750]|nr:hypothetical protein FS749_016144 [Ceratobasidium sp. UAMH 11750]
MLIPAEVDPWTAAEPIKPFSMPDPKTPVVCKPKGSTSFEASHSNVNLLFSVTHNDAKHAALYVTLAVVVAVFHYITESEFTQKPVVLSLLVCGMGHLGWSVVAFWLEQVELLAHMCLSIIKILVMYGDTIIYFTFAFAVYRMLSSRMYKASF